MTAPHADPRVFWRCSPGRRLPAYARDLADARARDLVPAQRQVAVYLARRLERDVKRVHEDAGSLVELGLIERTERGGLVCPFDDIHVDMHLKRAA